MAGQNLIRWRQERTGSAVVRRDACPKGVQMKTVCKVAAIVCMVAIFGQVGRCDTGDIDVLACLAGIVLWSMLGALFLALTGWLEHVR